MHYYPASLASYIYQKGMEWTSGNGVDIGNGLDKI